MPIYESLGGPTKWVNLYPVLSAADIPAPAQQIGEGDELPVDDALFGLFHLKAHPALPDGLYRYADGLWIQG
jgi:hypothetical protein